MGKRELLLIAVFVVVGTGVYQMTAPARPGGSGFSLSRLLEHVRSELRGQNVEQRVARSATAAVEPGVTGIRVDGLRGTITVLGEDRDDVTAELVSTAYGVDEAQASAFEKAYGLEITPDGDTLDVRVKMPGPEMHRRRRLELTIRVPEQLAVDLRTRGGELKVSRVARLTLGRAEGRAVLTEIAGGIDGEYVGGSLEIDKSGPLTLETERTELRISNVTGGVTLNATGSELRLRSVDGPTSLTLERVRAEVEGLAGPVTIHGDGGECRLREVRAPIEVEGDRLTLRVTLDTAIPVTASIENDLIEVTLPPAGVTLDAHAEHGQVRITDKMVEVESGENESRARGDIRGGGPLLKLATIRGDIVIR